MAAADASKEATNKFLKAHFRRYYEHTKPILPDRFGRREFGFMFWTAGIVQRHLGFSREDELKSFLASRVPSHVYYSLAYYEKTNAVNMDGQGWDGVGVVCVVSD